MEAFAENTSICVVVEKLWQVWKDAVRDEIQAPMRCEQPALSLHL